MNPITGTLLGFGVCALVACSEPPERGSDAASPPRVAHETASVPSAHTDVASPPLDGAKLLEKFQCNRCHDAGLPVAADKHCVRCHEQIVDGTTKLISADVARSWRPHVKPLRFAPSLSGVGSLVSEEWAKSYLRAPFDLRPHLHPEMPRLAITDAEAEALVQVLARENAFEPPASLDGGLGDVDKGRTLFKEKACGSCHRFSGAGLAEEAIVTQDADKAHLLAPDLRFARDRIVPGRLVPYLQNPTSIKKAAAMPSQNLTEQQARHLASFILNAQLLAVAPPARFRRLAVLTRDVGYDEVAARTFRKICWHCHSKTTKVCR